MKQNLFFNLKILLPLLILHHSSSGQGNHIELKAGINATTISDYSYQVYSTTIYPENVYSLGYYAGVLLQLNIDSNLSFISGLEFAFRKFRENIEFDYYPTAPGAMFHFITHKKVDITTSFYTIAVPVMLRYKFKNKIFNLTLGVIPYLSSSHSRGQIIESDNSPFPNFNFYVVSDINETSIAINSFGIDGVISISYFFYERLGIETAFQAGITQIFSYSTSSEYPHAYKGGRFYSYSLGVVYRLNDVAN